MSRSRPLTYITEQTKDLDSFLSNTINCYIKSLLLQKQLVIDGIRNIYQEILDSKLKSQSLSDLQIRIYTRIISNEYENSINQIEKQYNEYISQIKCNHSIIFGQHLTPQPNTSKAAQMQRPRIQMVNPHNLRSVTCTRSRLTRSTPVASMVTSNGKENLNFNLIANQYPPVQAIKQAAIAIPSPRARVSILSNAHINIGLNSNSNSNININKNKIKIMVIKVNLTQKNDSVVNDINCSAYCGNTGTSKLEIKSNTNQFANKQAKIVNNLKTSIAQANTNRTVDTVDTISTCGNVNTYTSSYSSHASQLRYDYNNDNQDSDKRKIGNSNSNSNGYYQCEICLKILKTKTGYISHKNGHLNIFPYICQYCNKKFTSNSSHKRHELLHKGEKLFECDICHRKFSFSSGLKAHMVTHTKEKPFQCHICKKKFTQISSLRRHQRMSHK